MKIIMDAFLIIIGVATAYVVFVTFAIALARAIFPTIKIDDEELAGDGLQKMKSKVKRLQSRITSRTTKVYNEKPVTRVSV